MGSTFGERRGVNVKGIFEEAIKGAEEVVVKQLGQEVEKRLCASDGL